jgi:5'-deoxynucleotidase YfbR-like HD superfamily hydrolase
MKLFLTLLTHDMVEVRTPDGTPVAVVHIDTFHQDDLEVYRELVNEGYAEVDVTLAEE